MGKTDPICGEKGTIEAYSHYFCSKECISIYEEKYNIKRERDYITGAKSEKWYREKTFLVILCLIWGNIGKKVAIWLPIITVPQILILGYLFNNFFK
ncbi:MAG: hypothetical protein WBA71_01065 [Candidatus Humimicrobiia bacterium]